MAIYSGTSPRVHVTPSAWFAIAIPATMAFLMTGSLLGSEWLGGLAVLALAAAGSTVARSRSRDALLAYLAGTTATLLGLYGALLVATHLYL